MNTPRYASAAAKLLTRHLPRASVEADEARQRSLATIERAMRVRARRRTGLAALAAVSGLAAAAAVVLIAKGSTSPVAPAPSAINVATSGQGVAIHAADGDRILQHRGSLESGQRIETPSGGAASLQLSTGTKLSLASKTSFRVDSQGDIERFSLQRGEMLAHVSKLSGGRRFIVATPDAEVEVRGTSFRLRVLDGWESCDARTRTRLDVTEGVVEVRAAGALVSVKAGESWPTGCHTKAVQPAASSAGKGAPVDDPARPMAKGSPSSAASRDVTAKRSGAATAEADSALSGPNDLFAEAVTRRRQGDVAGALRVYDAVVTRYPSSPLAENAVVERMRLLAGTEAGRAEARRYLARYSRGFALAEAQRLAAP